VAGIISGFITFIREAIGLLTEFANQAIRLINIVKPGADIGYIPNISPNAAALGFTGAKSAQTNPLSSLGVNPTVVNNITVQSIDSEGAARAVAKVLNQSASRSVPQLYNSGIRGD